MDQPGKKERGLSLIEVVVATAILSLAIVIALTVYDASRNAYSKGENATEQQESVRIAFDRVTSDLRMAGYNVNPDGNPDRPDEQFEGTLRHAVVLRADFDQTDAAASGVPEGALGGGAFPTVSTGNDEIVAYVLCKPDGTGPDTITFQADVREPVRDGRVEAVAIDNVVLDPVAPPYSLYRVTLNNDSSTYGGSAFIVRTPVVENVRDLSFTYYDAGGTFEDPSNAIAETSDAKSRRSGLARIAVSLIGMTRDPDLSYDDPSDAAARRNRKFELQGDVTPRNLRFVGVRDLNADDTPPSKPATPTLIPGHCRGLLVNWVTNPGVEGVTQYRINWGPSSSVVSDSRSVQGPPYFLDGLSEGSTYFVSIQAQDTEGNVSVRSDAASATEANSNTPSPPATLTTSTDRTYHVEVNWTPVVTNTANDPAADPQAPRLRDLAGYRLYSTSDGLPFPDLDDARHDAAENELGKSYAQPFIKTPVVACQNRHYVMTAVDSCGLESAPSVPVLGKAANPGVRPKPPEGLQASSQGLHLARIRWLGISEDVNDNSIRIEKYQVFRSAPIDGAASPAAAVWDPLPIAVVDDGVHYNDSSVPDLSGGQVVYYRVNGLDDCVNISEYSEVARLGCEFFGDVEIVSPSTGEVRDPVPVTVSIRNPQGVYEAVTITYERDGLVRQTFTGRMVGTSIDDYDWETLPVGDYTIAATVTNDQGCSETETMEVTKHFARP